jgi:hypothetical protein
MKSTLQNVALIFCVFLFLQNSIAQTNSYKNVVLASATVQNSPAEITLAWPSYSTATSYSVYRKTPSANSWGSALTTLSGTATSYADNSVSTGTLYEYKIARAASGSGVIACGYVLSGIETSLSHNKGNIILVIDNFFLPTLSGDINQLINDYENDGWFVKKVFVNRTDLVTNVKTQIVNEYIADSSNTKAVMLLGHIPVPYSGDNNPDGHSDHIGAWPADGFYGEMDGLWTDTWVNDVSATDVRNKNIPGDGKYDQDVLPNPLELEVGRVDFYNLPAFTKTETQLMKKYLNKLHSFKVRGFIPLDKGVVEDGFTGYTEGFAGSGYTSFAAMFGATNVLNVDFRTELQTNTDLWAYGCGAGNYTSASGIITTSNFATDSLRGVFTMLFGSYFGDWDTPNNLMRSALASGNILSCSWSGRPYWHYHQMAMGEDLGYCAKLTQNSNNLYFSSTLGCMCGYVQNGQMGDPSLRLHYIAPPYNLISINDAATGNVSLNWTASSETVLGYNIYRRDTLVNSWTKLNPTPITTTAYTDNAITAGGVYSYMVRATRMQTTASGTYYNLSLGAKTLISSVVSVSVTELDKKNGFSVFPNPFVGGINIVAKQNQSKVAVLVTDILGIKVYEKEVDFIQNEKVHLNLSQVEAGIYFVNVNHQTYKVVKNN